MYQKTIEKLAKVKADIQAGSTVEEALKKHSMSAATYYSAKSKRKTKSKAPSVIELQSQPRVNDELVTIALIKCSTETASKLLKGY